MIVKAPGTVKFLITPRSIRDSGSFVRVIPPHLESSTAMRKLTCPALVALLALVVAAPAAHAATGGAATSAAAWDHVTGAASRAATAPATPLVDPARFAAFSLDQDALAQVLTAAPAERRRGSTVTTPASGLDISIPTPDGGFARFAVVDSPVMEPGLAAAHPEIKTYAGRGLDDPTATVRLDLTPGGFHASVRSDAGAWYVDPRYADLSQYVAYRRPALSPDPYVNFVEREDPAPPGAAAPTSPRAGEANGAPVTLRVYRLALVSDNTYADHTPGATTDAKVTLMNRVDQIYEQDFAIRMDLIDGNDQLNLDTAAAATGANGPCGAAACFTAGQLAFCDVPTLDRDNVVAGHIVGAGSYDLAHLVLGVDGGGIAGLRVVGTAGKGRGCTGLPTPVGDYFAVDYVAHEMGHQFGGDHTFNGTTNSSSNCGPDNRSTTQAARVEPGSGTSVMAYAGICGQDDLQAHSDPYFSQASITEISNYVTGAETAQAPVQQAALTGYSAGTTAFAITYNGQTSATLGGTLTATNIKNAIQAIPGWPAGATVSVSGVSTAGFTVTFGGTLAAGTPAALGIANPTGGVSGFFGTVAVAGTTGHGGAGATTSNHAPNVSAAGTAYTIPARTPFTLDATGSDADGDPLTYLWEQNDPGGTTAIPLVSNTKTNGPLFRMFGTAARYADPVDDPYDTPSPGENTATAATARSFPDIAQVLDDDTDAATGACPAAPGSGTVPAVTVDCFSEYLPTADWVGVDGTRTMHFRVTARDDHAGYGGVGHADTAVTVASTAGPFRLTSQATDATVTEGDPLTVTWNVAGTTANGINTSNVKISLSLDGGQTFTRVLAASTPNDGTQTVTLPAVATTEGRIKVEAVGNVFFDASRGTLTITTTDPVLLSAPPTADLGSVVLGAQGAPVDVTFTNAGTATATLAGPPALSGPDQAAVELVSTTCGASLASHASCTATVRLVPTHTGAQSASLTLTATGGSAPATVALSGSSAAVPLISGPVSADLGTATVGQTGPATLVTFTNHGSAPATTNALTVSGPDAAAVTLAADGCGTTTLAAHASCSVTLRLVPAHAGAQSATLALRSSDPASPAVVTLTGTGTAVVTPPPDTGDDTPRPPAVLPVPTPITPTPPPVLPPVPVKSVLDQARDLAKPLLGITTTPTLLGTAGHLRVFAASKSTKLGKPKATRTLAVATCVGGTCAGKASVRLTRTSRTGRRTSKTITIGTLRLASGKAKKLTLKLSSKDRKAIAGARKASLTLTVTNATKKVTKTFTLTT
jgi:hypothetical protein